MYYLGIDIGGTWMKGALVHESHFEEGNKLQLIGALAIAKGEVIAIENKIENQCGSLQTELPHHKNLHLEKMKTSEILETFWEAEQDAGQWLKESLPIISKVVGSYMVDVACINNKLIKRAQSILGILFNMDKEEALLQLKKADL